ncbi:MAG: GTPase HflX, partial [Thermodesulfovibrionales bacterium]
FLPPLEDYPLGKRPLRGLRLIHTHLNDETLNKDDITDLSLLRFDLIAAIGIRDGQPVHLHIAHLVPQTQNTTGNTTPGTTYELQPPKDFYNHDFDFIPFVAALEDEFERSQGFVISGSAKRRDQLRGGTGVQKHGPEYSNANDSEQGNERAILVSVSTESRHDQEDSVDELAELARSSNVTVLERVIQSPKQINPRYLLGEGKLKDLVITAMNRGATLLIFDQDLNPSQIRAINELTELKVIDRSQLILDIFAGRAHSRDGKVQVELAQLKYRLPRLSGRGTAMSKLMGGIGGRGPGEMKLEIDRRRVRDRITLLEKELTSLGEARRQRKARRVENQVPIISIVGYTNAGKSTLLNTLTRSRTFVEDKLFATLDTASRRLRFPHEREVIITDTVGFIRDLPKDLVAAFKSTLEELEDADLLLHVVDISNQRFEQHMASVDTVLKDLHLENKKRLLVFNKADLIPPAETAYLSQRFHAIAVSAVDNTTFAPLLSAIEAHVFDEKREAAKV